MMVLPAAPATMVVAMARPEDVIVTADAVEHCNSFGLSVEGIKHARACAALWSTVDGEAEVGTFLSQTGDGVAVRVMCTGPELLMVIAVQRA